MFDETCCVLFPSFVFDLCSRGRFGDAPPASQYRPTELHYILSGEDSRKSFEIVWYLRRAYRRSFLAPSPDFRPLVIIMGDDACTCGTVRESRDGVEHKSLATTSPGRSVSCSVRSYFLHPCLLADMMLEEASLLSASPSL